MAVTLVIRMAHVVFTVRMLVGATLLLFGLDDLMSLFEIDYGKKGGRFVSAVEGTGYLQQVRGSLLMVCGLLFVVARWVPLALILFAPIILNILIFHAFLAPAKITIAEVDELVPVGELNPDEIHLPGIYVQRIIKGEHYEKWIEQRTVRTRGEA